MSRINHAAGLKCETEQNEPHLLDFLGIIVFAVVIVAASILLSQQMSPAALH